MTKEEERALKRALMPQYAEVERLDETNEPVGRRPGGGCRRGAKRFADRARKLRDAVGVGR